MPNLDKDKDFTWLPELFSYLLAFSSVCFDLIIQEMLQLQYIQGIHAGPGPH